MHFVHRLSVAAATAVAFAAGLQAGTVMITTDTTVGCDDMSLDGMDVIVDGAILTIDCDHTFNSLMLINNGVVTHSVGGAIPAGESDAVGLHLTITNDCMVDGGCLIRANLRGHEPASGPGAGLTGNVAGGGGHGGQGGDGRLSSYPGVFGGPAYGSITEPVTFGSGGGDDDDSAFNGGRGGGALRLTIGGTCTIDGTIASNGGDFSGNQAGGGAGGSVWIDCGALAGEGGIHARGGAASTVWSGSGSGGRISVAWDSSSFTGEMSAYGGDAYNDGGAGTIYTRNKTSGQATLLVDNNGNNSSEPTGIIGATSIDADLVVSNGAFLGHARGEAGVSLTVSGNATFDVTSGIDVNGYGHLADTGPGTGISGGQVSGGAGHAGAGGNGADNYPDAIGGGCYGSLEMPTTHGSGGGSDVDGGSDGGAGGGAFHLVVGGDCTVEGALMAQGEAFLGQEAGGGSGGSIWVEAENLLGAGTISADGGGGNTVFAGGGGGGRIAVHADTSGFTGAMTACGGNARKDGGAGTVYVLDPDTGDATLIIDNCGMVGEATEFTGTSTIDADVMIDNGGSIAHAHMDAGLDLTIIGDCNVGIDGRIDLDARGHLADEGPSPGGSDNVSGGGGHGGAGGNGVDILSYPNSFGGDCYGSVLMPVTFGSGAGSDADNGSSFGRGGGAIHLTVTGAMTVDGSVSARGEFSTQEAGGGAGGSLWLEVGSLHGIGTINADGGQGNTVFGGGGGGGRISISYDSEAFMSMRGGDDRITACGGNGRNVGGAGTIYLKDNDDALGNLVVDNCSNGGEATEFSGYNALNANLNVREGGLLTHKHEDLGLHFDFAGSAEVGPLGTIGGVGRGYPTDSGPAPGTSDNVSAGGGHGGAGGDTVSDITYPNAFGGGCYGSVEMPIEFGSGGAMDADHGVRGGAGGPAIRMTLGGTLTVDGVISADGAPFEGREAGGGAGGSIWIETTTLAGTGTIRADGGGGNTVFSGGGGGGRIAIYCDDNQLTDDTRGVAPTGAITACGGNARAIGGAGTIYIDDASAPRPVLIVDNCAQNGEATEFSGPNTFDADLIVRNMGLLTHPHNEAGLELTFTGDVDVQEEGTIGGKGRGMPSATGPGAGTSDIVAGGGGYGGNGGDAHPNYPGVIGGSAYGSLTMPTDLGSGGGADIDAVDARGGAGGGALKLIIGGDLNVDGVLSMDGGDFEAREAGGGSGGSLWVVCNLITGSGRISTLGGTGNSVFGGGGGGGRIVIENTAAAFAGQLTVCGGEGTNDGAQGTAILNSAFLCPGDTNCDQVVDFDDLNILLDYWGLMDSRGDLNGDGVVNFTDLEILLEAWGTFCS